MFNAGIVAAYTYKNNATKSAIGWKKAGVKLILAGIYLALALIAWHFIPALNPSCPTFSFRL